MIFFGLSIVEFVKLKVYVTMLVYLQTFDVCGLFDLSVYFTMFDIPPLCQKFNLPFVVVNQGPFQKLLQNLGVNM